MGFLLRDRAGNDIAIFSDPPGNIQEIRSICDQACILLREERSLLIIPGRPYRIRA